MTNRLRLMMRSLVIIGIFGIVVWALRSSRPAPSSRSAAKTDTAAADGKSASAAQREGLRLPVAGVDTGELRDTYDAPRSGGRSHEAIDILAPQGTPVYAATDGTIAQHRETRGGGRSIYQIGPDSAWVYFYAHLNRYADDLADGDRVRRGEVIGYVGDTGNAPEGVYHLHFGVWALTDSAGFWHGPPVNPYPLLTGERRRK
jgi:murein DD-endopeptidase MepM/ murein hydrolase activator NlpD